MFDDIICMDRYGNTVRSLCQWDLDQTLYIYNTNYPVAPIFHYSNQNTPEALVVQSVYMDGVLQCVVPNQLMVEPYPITGYLYVPETEKGGTVVGMFKIPVRPRTKPCDFQYEDNIEVINLEVMRDIVLAAVASATASESAAAASATASAASATASAESASSASRDAAIATAGATLAAQSVADAAEQVSLASDQVDLAAAQVSLAEDKAYVSEGHATGTRDGVPVGSGSPYYHNNAKYWSEQAAAIASQTLGGLTDVGLDNVHDGQVLTYDNVNHEWTNKDPVLPPSSLGDLTDVDGQMQPVDGDALVFDDFQGAWSTRSFDLSKLNDVYLASPPNGAALIYDATNHRWVAGSVQSDPYSKGVLPPENINIFWVDLGSGGVLKYYNGTAWVPVASVWT